MSISARRRALNALMQITGEGAYSNLALKTALEGATSADAAWASAAVYTALDNLSYLDYVIGHYAKGRVQPVTKNVLRLGLCQLLFMDTPASAACDESVKLMKQCGKNALAGFVNGVLRAICRDRESNSLPALPTETLARLAVRYGYPEFLISEYLTSYGEDFTERMLSYTGASMTVRAQYPYTTAQLEQALCDLGVGYTRGKLLPEALRLDKGMNLNECAAFCDGQMSVQSESAMLVCRLAAPAPNMRILDACAAPGGKSAYMASLSENMAQITAWELHSHRAQLMQNTFSRLNVTGAEVAVMDASLPHPEYNGGFDVVLVDAPCSGFGVFGKPDIRYGKTLGDIEALAGVQAAILDCCAEYVKSGGALVYATCTVSNMENQQQALSFLQRHKEFFAADIRPYLPEMLHERIGDEGCGIQLFPHLDGTEGFYMARFTRE